MKQELLQLNKRTLRDLHDAFTIDFQSNVTIKKIELPKTLKRIIADNSEITKDTLNILLIKGIDKRVEFSTITFDIDGNYNIDLGEIQQLSWNSSLRTYYRKSDFETDRKRADLQCYLIVATKEQLKGQRKDNYRRKIEESWFKDGNTRMVYSDTKVMEMWYNDLAEKTVYKLDNLKSMLYNNETIYIDFHRYPHRLREVKTIHDYIDKSGYNVWQKRKDLEYRTNTLKANRNIGKLKNHNFSEENKTLINLANEVKQLITSKLAAINTSKGFRAIGQILNYDYGWTIQSLEEHMNKMIKIHNDNDESYGKYKSVEEVQAVINELTQKLNTVKEKISNYDEPLEF